MRNGEETARRPGNERLRMSVAMRILSIPARSFKPGNLPINLPPPCPRLAVLLGQRAAPSLARNNRRVIPATKAPPDCGMAHQRVPAQGNPAHIARPRHVLTDPARCHHMKRHPGYIRHHANNPPSRDNASLATRQQSPDGHQIVTHTAYLGQGAVYPGK